jgi:hypothetical protein
MDARDRQQIRQVALRFTFSWILVGVLVPAALGAGIAIWQVSVLWGVAAALMWWGLLLGGWLAVLAAAGNLGRAPQVPKAILGLVANLAKLVFRR